METDLKKASDKELLEMYKETAAYLGFLNKEKQSNETGEVK